MTLLSHLKWRILFLVTFLTVIFDQLTKWMVMDRFKLHESIPVIDGFFSLTYIRNPGAAFGIFANADPSFRGPFFMLIPLVALFVIGLVFKRLPPDNWTISSALSLVIGGAVGNFVDRLRFGSVVDFLDFHWNYLHHFPAFNVADSGICVGVGILMLDLLFNREHNNPKEAHVSHTV